jgi:hypothetical protein
MVDPNTPASTRVRAADSVLDHSAKAIEMKISRRAWRNWSEPRKNWEGDRP